MGRSQCYFAYIDKSMQSNVRVEQIIGRVLRQPGLQHVEAEILNTAHFYVRVDTKGIFADIVKEVGKRIAGELPEVQFTAYDPKKKNRPTPKSPKTALQVPHIYRDPSAALHPIDDIIKGLIDFRGDTGENIRGAGANALVQQRVGADEEAEVKWVERDHGNAVSARWVFQTAVRRQFPLALEVTRSDDPKFDASIELGSPADQLIRRAASEVVQRYLEHVVLKQRPHNPYVVGEVMVDPTAAEPFTNSLHGPYSGLNKTLELPFADELDKAGVTWCRNPPRSGFGIPLLSPGQSKVFYPDFLAWKAKNVFALDTKGEHILETELGRKLLAIEPNPKAKARLLVRLISKGNWDDHPQRVSADGLTVWALGHANALKPIHCATMAEAVKVCLRATL
jgi:type III restriction enzyme